MIGANVSRAPGRVWDGGRSTALPLSVFPRAQLRDVPVLKAGRDRMLLVLFHDASRWPSSLSETQGTGRRSKFSPEPSFLRVNNPSCLRLSAVGAPALRASSWSPLNMLKQVHVLLMLSALE